METKLNEERKFDPLPIDETTKDFKLGEEKVCSKEKHAFMYVTATEVECMNCPIGYKLPVGGILKNDHIYIDGKFVL